MKKTMRKGIILGAAITIAIGVIGGVTMMKPRILNPWSGRTNDKDGIELAILNPWG